MFANSPPFEKAELYTPNDEWSPSEPINEELLSRSTGFNFNIRRIFGGTRRKAHSNLLPTQEAALRWLQLHPEIVVFNADKNLGPCIMEREEYLRYTWKDHLSDANTYQRLSQEKKQIL